MSGSTSGCHRRTVPERRTQNDGSNRAKRQTVDLYSLPRISSLLNRDCGANLPRMPPRLSIPLPKLTLFTGPECSLCDVGHSLRLVRSRLIPWQVAKAELVQIRKTHPFDIKLWNIRAPPPDSDEREAKKWRRLYQYEIVSGL